MLKMKAVFSLFIMTVSLSCQNLFGQVTIDRFFPDTTQGYIAISDVKVLQQKWQQTQFHEILHDPMFDEFRASLRTQLEDAWTTRFGMKLTDILSIPSGEIGTGLIAIPGKKPGFALIMDTTGKAEQVNEFLVQIIRKTTSTKKGDVRKERLTVGNQSIDATVLTFPPDQNHSTARTAYYVALQNLLIVTDQKFLAEILLTRVAGDNQDALIDSPAYQAVISRCMTGRSQNEKPQIHFFIRPLEAGEAIRSLSNLTPQQKAKTSPFSILAKQGFDGIQGVGGTIDLASQGCESIYRVKVYVPEPAQQALKMFAVSNVKQILPPAWMGDNVLRCTLFNINILTVFNNIGPLFDEIYETEGAWNEILEQLEQDKRGPQVNLRTELIANFGSELVSMTAFDPDKPEEGEKFIFSLNIKPGKNQEVIDVLHRMFDTDPAFKVIQIGNEPAWQYSQSAPEKSRRTTSRNRSANVSTPAPVAGSGNELEIIKGGVFCVSDNYLMISNDLGFLTQTIQNMKSGTTQSIVNDPFYQKINNIIANDTSQNGLFVQGYIHNVDGVRVNYDLIRQNKLMDGRTLSARLWKLIFTAPDQVTGEKPIDIDGSKLPPFEKIQDKIGIGGFYGWVEQDGWYYQGFSVRKDNDPMSPGNRK